MITLTVLMNSYREDPDNFFRAAQSALYQPGLDVQLLISTVKRDPCIEWAREMQLPVIENEKPGIFSQLNAMVSHIQGQYVCYSSSNDMMYPNRVQEIMTLERTGADVCYSNYDQHYADKGKLRTIECPTVYTRSMHLKGNFVSDCAMVRSETLKRYMPFREEYHNHAYHDLWLRMSGDGCRFVHQPMATWQYIRTANSQSLQRRRDPDLRNLNEMQRTAMLQDHQ